MNDEKLNKTEFLSLARYFGISIGSDDLFL